MAPYGTGTVKLYDGFSTMLARMTSPLVASTRAIIFDCGGVLMHPDDRVLSSILSSVSCQPILGGTGSLAIARTIWDGADSSDPVGFWQSSAAGLSLRKHLGITDAEGLDLWKVIVSASQTGVRLWSQPDADAVYVLSSLARSGMLVAVVSNNDGGLAKQLEGANLSEYCDVILDSSVVGFSKPDPEIFSIASAQLDVPLENCIMVGDDPFFDVEASLAAGVGAAVLVDRFRLGRPTLTFGVETIAELEPFWNRPSKR